MGRGYRFGIGAALVALIIVCVGFGLYVGALTDQAPQPKAEPEQRDAATKVQPASSARPLPVVVVNQPADPANYQDPCQGAESDKRSDLCAQWTAANSARDAAYYAKLQLGAAILGMVGLIITIILTHKAVKAAQQSVAVAQDTAKRQLRAYLIIQNVKITTLIAGQIPKVQYELKNVGQTPAYEVRLIISTAFEDFAGVAFDETKVRFRKERGPGSKAIIGAGERVEIELPFRGPVSGKGVADLKANTLKFGLFGVVSYRDVFKRRRLLTVKRAFNPAWMRNDGTAVLVHCRKGNHAN